MINMIYQIFFDKQDFNTLSIKKERKLPSFIIL